MTIKGFVADDFYRVKEKCWACKYSVAKRNNATVLMITLRMFFRIEIINKKRALGYPKALILFI